MLPEARRNIPRIAAKEMTLFFTSPVAYLFLAAFGAVSFFAVFWGETFFARNLADARPLFEWMPLLLLFLASAVTMRMWSEERRQGTIEHVLTSPVPVWHFVVGKFLACLGLLGAGLLLTVPFPLTVSLLGDLDWGPVVAGYLATGLLGASYLAIGLFVSSRSSNQIVSLLASVAIGGLLYLIGSPSFTELFHQQTADWLKLLGTGSRFESIVRGVVDLSDLAYYAGLVLSFLSLNAYVLESERWTSARTSRSKADWKVVTGLIVANAIGLNLWLGQLRVRVDVTEGDQYSLSQTTHELLDSLHEPLRIKAYFSSKTHPLLTPLVPQLKDLLKEYEEVSSGAVRVEIIDPQHDPEAEKQARDEFGIEPVPFQVTDRYEASIVSSYFNIVIKYGDSFEVLGFGDLIELKAHTLDNVDVQLRNPEYDITRAIKKVRDSYQREGRLFDTLSQPVTFQLLASSPEALPEKLAEFRAAVEGVVKKMEEKSEGKLLLELHDPDRDGKASALAQEYGFQPMVSGLFDGRTFYFYMVMRQGEKAMQIPLGDLSEGAFERNFNSALKRFGSGFAKTVALAGGSDYRQLQRLLEDELNVESEDLSDGSVSGAADILLLLGPDSLKPEEVYAVDQFLMRGGTVVAATSPFRADLSSNSLRLEKRESGLEEWLKHLGVTLEESLVLDPRCAALPIPVTRYVAGHAVQTLQLLDYPYFLDVRREGFVGEHPALTNLAQLTASWASPISATEEASFTPLLRSSEEAWLSSSTNVMPQLDERGRPLYAPTGTQSSKVIAGVLSGPFESYFTGERLKEVNEVARASVSRSPDSARLVIISSPSMFGDGMVGLLSSLGAGDPLANFSLLANLVDWATEDESLLSIRSRSHFKRTLYPLEKREQLFWEWLNYSLALLILGAIWLVSYLRLGRRRRDYQEWLQRS